MYLFTVCVLIKMLTLWTFESSGFAKLRNHENKNETFKLGTVSFSKGKRCQTFLFKNCFFLKHNKLLYPLKSGLFSRKKSLKEEEWGAAVFASLWRWSVLFCSEFVLIRLRSNVCCRGSQCNMISERKESWARTLLLNCPVGKRKTNIPLANHSLICWIKTLKFKSFPWTGRSADCRCQLRPEASDEVSDKIAGAVTWQSAYGTQINHRRCDMAPWEAVCWSGK
jgi:hypothetical protein